jgi:hypothetical protein
MTPDELAQHQGFASLEECLDFVDFEIGALAARRAALSCRLDEVTAEFAALSRRLDDIAVDFPDFSRNLDELAQMVFAMREPSSSDEPPF